MKPLYPMGTMTFDSDSGFKVGPARIEAAFPNGFRIAEFPDGSRELQGAYAWTQGTQGGIVWKPVPLVQVDEQGEVVSE